MNEKTLNLYVNDYPKILPLYISNFVPSVYVNGGITTACLVAHFDGSTALDYVYENSLTNLVLNPSFETYTSASKITNWVIDYPDVQSVNPTNTALPGYVYSGCACLGMKLQVETTGSASSGSFAVTVGSQYVTSLWLLSTNGFFNKTVTIGGIDYIQMTAMPAYYTASLKWYTVGGTYLSQDTFINSYGTTTGIPTIEFYPVCTSRICPAYPVNVSPPGEWFNFVGRATAPATAAWGKIYIEGSTVPVDTDSLESIIIGGEALVYADSVISSLNKTSFLTIYPTANILIEDNFWCITPTVNTTPYTLTFSTSATSLMDFSARSDNYYSAVDTKLTIGRDATGTWKAWIPFDIDFSVLSSASGAHINSASLVITAAATKIYDSSKTCAVNVGFESTTNLTQPTDWTTVNSKIPNEGAITSNIAETWAEGATYNIDITSTAKHLFKAPRADGTYPAEGEGISWTNSASAAILIRDWGSSVDEYRTIVSDEGSSTIVQPAKISLNYSYNNYTESARDTNINSTNTATIYLRDTVYYKSPVIYIGAVSTGSARGLIYFDVSSIPPTSTITSACLSLYHEQINSTGTGSLCAYQMLKNWDLYTATWNRQLGTKTWDGGGGAGSVVDYKGSSLSGSLALSPTESIGWKNFNIDKNLITGWITSASPNYGLMLKTEKENNDMHKFTSSDASSNKPYMTVYYTYLATPYTKTIQNTTGTVANEYLTSIDSYIDSSSTLQSTNYGGLSYLWVKGPSFVYRTLIKGNLTGAVTTGITSAKLKIYCSEFASTDGTSGIINVYRILKNWSETGVTWLSTGYTTWATAGMGAGTDYYGTSMGTCTIAPYSTGWKEITLSTSEVSNMISSNYGIVIVCSHSLNAKMVFHSRSGTNTPKLYIYY